MQMENMHSSMSMQPLTLISQIEHHSISGTDVEPGSTPFHMIMFRRGQWQLMLHGEAFVSDIQQSGPRGTDKLFSTNWLMFNAEHHLGPGAFTVKTMFSLEPATISGRRYPELFQEGETAYGLPIVDGQHPHNFFMELAAVYDCKFGEGWLASFYAAPMGDPALGPAAYPHRASASEDPIAPLGHHLQDSTHIAADVLTAGITRRNIRLEASGFHGREPDESRWTIQSGAIDSWSTRVTVNPRPNWSTQYSIGQLHSPEMLNPAEDVRRMTASVSYNRPLHRGNWASMALWGRNQSLSSGNVGNGYLFESTLQFAKKNFLWTRIEDVDRTNDLLIGENQLPPGFMERYFARVQAYTAGYDRDIWHVSHVSAALGAQVTAYGVPSLLQPDYGTHPAGVVVFLRLRARE